MVLAFALPLAWAQDPGGPAEPVWPTQPALPATCPDLPAPPAGAWPRSSPDPTAVAALEAYAFPPEVPGPERLGVRTDAVVIVKGGQVVYERYARGWTAESRHLVWSVTKSFVGALTGAAADLGVLTLDTGVCEVLADLPDAACQVTVNHLLEWGSGFAWAETYENEPPTTSSVLAMLYGEGRGDMAAFVASHALRDPPGTTYAYSSGDSNLLSAVVKGAVEPVQGPAWTRQLLFDPIGAGPVTWETDGRGVPVGSSYLWMTPLDMARFGWLLRSDGCWGGDRVLPEGWVATMHSGNDSFRSRDVDMDGGPIPGRHLWRNAADAAAGHPDVPWPDVPTDAYAALGHWGQSIIVIPSWDMVVVRTADDRDGTFDRNRYLQLARAVADSAVATVEAP